MQAALASIPPTSVGRRPTRSASWPPIGCEAIEPAPSSATIVPARPGERSRAAVR